MNRRIVSSTTKLQRAIQFNCKKERRAGYHPPKKSMRATMNIRQFDDLYCEDCKKITEWKISYFSQKCSVCGIIEEIK